MVILHDKAQGGQWWLQAGTYPEFWSKDKADSLEIYGFSIVLDSEVEILWSFFHSLPFKKVPKKSSSWTSSCFETFALPPPPCHPLHHWSKQGKSSTSPPPLMSGTPRDLSHPRTVYNATLMSHPPVDISSLRRSGKE